VNLDFPTLNQRLSNTLAGKSFVIKGQKTGIKKLDLGVADRKSGPGWNSPVT